MIQKKMLVRGVVMEAFILRMIWADSHMILFFDGFNDLPQAIIKSGLK
jgi:hypothetical protein